MSRFIYIADTHLGDEPMRYQQQKGYSEKLPEITAALRKYIDEDGNIDFVLHGGDMIDAATKDNIIRAAEVFDFSVPVYLCLGNHDLTILDALQHWLKLSPGYFPDKTPEYTITTADCLIHVVPNQWDNIPYYWGNMQNTHFSNKQIKSLKKALNQKPDFPHIILTHSPVYGLPAEQTGFAEPYHYPPATFTNKFTDLITDHDNVYCVLGAHNHMNMIAEVNQVHFVTVSSLVETPFEFKLFDISESQITMSTVNLIDFLDFNSNYDFNKTFVQGRAKDRTFSVEM